MSNQGHGIQHPEVTNALPSSNQNERSDTIADITASLDVLSKNLEEENTPAFTQNISLNFSQPPAHKNTANGQLAQLPSVSEDSLIQDQTKVINTNSPSSPFIPESAISHEQNAYCQYQRYSRNHPKISTLAPRAYPLRCEEFLRRRYH